MKTYLKASEVAKLVRKDLKNAFPEIKFSVRSDTSIRVTYNSDKASERQVLDVIGFYAGETFDGMTDMRSSNGAFAIENGVEMISLASFVFVNNENYDFENSLRNRPVILGI